MRVPAHRHWALAGLAGASAVIVPCALLMAWWFRYDMLLGRGQQSRVLALVQNTGLVLLAGSIVGVPIALLFTGVMALLERDRAGFATLAAWATGGIVAGLPMIYVGTLLLGGLNPLIILFDLIGVVGASVAWFVRHGRAGRLA